MATLNFLAVSIGNTRTRVGAFVDNKLVESATLENRRDGDLGEAMEHAFTPLRENKQAVVLMSSVNPAGTQRIEAQIAKHLNRQVLRVERDMPIPIGRQLDREAIVGEDRLLNAAAAYDVLKQACVVVDAGTAITVDFVDGAGTFHGGAIAPGAQLMLDSLHQRAAQLPEVEFDKPTGVMGHNTVEAMRVGVFHGLRGMVRELVERYAEKAGGFPAVIASGGDANLLFREYDLVDRVVPDLTLNGLAVTLRVAMEQEQK
ncbi:type III pantothenate kinase [Phycisphaerales bacterium AB-hyl4]|uniref:Type III pantothenate kinase n=1 Tax=Natronomicrosphaera hydrolytica TaxID=3242702 RepID=A0ABV4U5Z4_9BACT